MTVARPREGQGTANERRWLIQGYKLGRVQAEEICREMGRRSDRRTSEEREAGVRASFTTRTLTATANRIRMMSRPEDITAALLPDEPVSEPVLPCDLWLPPADMLRAGTPIATLAQELAQPGRPRTFPKGEA